MRENIIKPHRHVKACNEFVVGLSAGPPQIFFLV